MKKAGVIFLSAIGLFMAQLAQAQGTLYLSTLGQPPASSAPIGSDAWIAQRFGTGSNPGGYTINSIQLFMNPASGSPSGFAVSIYNRVVGSPGSSLGSLSGVDPSAGGVFSYTTSGITLSPSTIYYVVLTAATPVAEGSYYWGAGNTYNYSVSDGWFLEDIYYSSPNGSSWVGHARQDVFQFAVYATAVPEPSSVLLAIVGGSVMVWFGRKVGP